MSTGGIIADHAADGSSVRSRSVGAKLQPQRTDVRVQLVLNQARLDATPEILFVYLKNVLHVFGEIHHDGVTHRLTGERSAAAARKNGNVQLVGDLDHRLNVAFMARHDHADRLDLIYRCIGGIQQTRVTIEANIAFNSLL